MRVFLSWSKRRSQAIAEAWAVFLPDVLQVVETFLSSEDLQAGGRWTGDLADALGDMDHGIICITPENREEPWIHFEAGALSKKPGTAKVVPFLYELEGSQLHASLAQFNYRPFTREGVSQIVASINRDLGNLALDTDRLKRAFGKHFPDFEERLKQLPKLTEEEQRDVKPERKQDEMIAEILAIVRQQQRPAANVTLPGLQVRPGLENAKRSLALEAFSEVVETAQYLRRHLLTIDRDTSQDSFHLGQFQKAVFKFVGMYGNYLTLTIAERFRTFMKIVERFDADHLPDPESLLGDTMLIRNLLLEWTTSE